MCPSSDGPLAHLASGIRNREGRSISAIRVKSDAIENAAPDAKKNAAYLTLLPTILMPLLLPTPTSVLLGPYEFCMSPHSHHSTSFVPNLHGRKRHRAAHFIRPRLNFEHIADPRCRHVRDVYVRRDTRLLQPCGGDRQAAKAVDYARRDGAVQCALGVHVGGAKWQPCNDCPVRGGGQGDAWEEEAVDGA